MQDNIKPESSQRGDAWEPPIESLEPGATDFNVADFEDNDLPDEFGQNAPPGLTTPRVSQPTARTDKQRQEQQKSGPREVADDPHRLSRLFLNQYGREQGLQTLHWHRGEWFRFAGFAYEKLDATEVRAALTDSVKAEFDRIAQAQWEILKKQAEGEDVPPPAVRKVTGRVIADAMRALEGACLLPGRLEQPAWLGDDDPPPWPAAECLVTRNGIVHVPAADTGQDAILPCTPSLFTTNCVPYAYDRAAGCPNWMQFLQSLWSDDPESIGTLQEWFGYNLLPDTRQHKLMMLIGPPRSGKGTIARVLRGVIGAQNLASPTLSSLAGPFGLWPLLGKLVALIADARLSGRTDAIAVVERLLSISGEDPQDVARKNLPTLTGLRLPTRFTLMTNELPNMRDASGALLTRVILLRLTRSFTGREDKHLGERLSRELPGILNWAAAGHHRLSTRGYFNQPSSGRELLEDLADMASPISAFIEDACHLGPEYEVSVEDLFRAWQSWCDDHGRDHPGTQQTFGRDLRAARPEINVSNRRILTTRQRYYQGIAIRT